ncbi:unnamed protein product [Toxocara canis]|uniref:Uncharacterized protein n=1 Tax=Toxocara canis TaxID=6265 RepID=A0A183UFC9_TOXCA|nr:unnamed protein product [Toxocara canis]
MQRKNLDNAVLCESFGEHLLVMAIPLTKLRGGDEHHFNYFYDFGKDEEEDEEKKKEKECAQPERESNR